MFNQVWMGDCMELMKNIPDKSMDIVVTSPPYNLNKKASGGGSSNMTYDGWYYDDMEEQDYQNWQKKVIRELIRITKGSIFYNHKVRYAWHNRNKYRHSTNLYHPLQWLSEFPIWCEIIWDRCGTSGHTNRRCKMADERIYQINKPHKFHDMGYTTIWRIKPSKNEGHVCSFPEELVERCILMSTDENDVVFDPFLGSGTTAIVAKKLGRRYLGIEKDKNYYDLSINRLRESYHGLSR
jgi:site-specific DNA-methyltransferase (adenine-specific)